MFITAQWSRSSHRVSLRVLRWPPTPSNQAGAIFFYSLLSSWILDQSCTCISIISTIFFSVLCTQRGRPILGVKTLNISCQNVLTHNTLTQSVNLYIWFWETWTAASPRWSKTVGSLWFCVVWDRKPVNAANLFIPDKNSSSYKTERQGLSATSPTGNRKTVSSSCSSNSVRAFVCVCVCVCVYMYSKSVNWFSIAGSAV